jgi:S-adenosylmethionine:tRNA ribosyltransferase-isomerase
MKLSDFDYNLPKELIAQYPLKDRLSCRLLVLDRKKKSIEHRKFPDLLDYLKKDDLLVLNDSKVLTCRLKGKRITGGKVEVLLLNRKSDLIFEALIKPARVKVGEKIIFKDKDIFCEVSAKNKVTFQARDIEEIYGLGVMPLPPYIKRETEDLDNIYYQTVYARENGSVASPTAGLHFTRDFLKKIEQAGINPAYVTLHVGYATFKPVKCEDITKHVMGKEYFQINSDTVNMIEKTRDRGTRICAVGTTSLRTLETFAASGRKQGFTDLFIYPGYKFKMVDHLLTNFHLPKTTLFMLVCAFAGEELAKEAYQQAIDEKYRFYSYGDAMLII